MNRSIIIFYKYLFLEHPNKIQKWQKQLCTDLHLKGRIIIAQEGINGTLGGSRESIELYVKIMHEHENFNDIDFKQTDDTGDHFPRLRIIVKDEIVNTGMPAGVAPFTNAGQPLTPAQAHEFIKEKDEDTIILDARNFFESEIGRIDGAIRAPIGHFRDFPAYIDEQLSLFKNKKILMYCTAGVRCERASAYLKSKGVTQEVYHIQGGIHRYVEEFPNGFFKGKNYVFDGRTSVKITNDILSVCQLCSIACDEYNNCMRAACNKHFLACSVCLEKYDHFCSNECYQLVQSQQSTKRPERIKDYSYGTTSQS